MDMELGDTKKVFVNFVVIDNDIEVFKEISIFLESYIEVYRGLSSSGFVLKIFQQIKKGGKETDKQKDKRI